MTPTYTDELVMIAELTLAPGQRDAFLAYTIPNLTVSRAAPGNLGFDMLLDPERPGTVLFHEVWTSAEAQQAYMAGRIAAGDLTRLLSYLAAPPRFIAWRRVAA